MTRRQKKPLTSTKHKHKCCSLKSKKGIHPHIFVWNLGSTEERTVLEKAEEYGCNREKSNPPQADVDVTLPTLEISVGDDFELDLEFVNRSNQRRTVEAYVSGSVVYYTGVSAYEFLFKTPTVTIGPQKSKKKGKITPEILF